MTKPGVHGTRVGMIGIGTMGHPMAEHLIGAGLPLSIWCRRPESATRLLELGAELAPSPVALAGRCEVVLTMLPDSSDVEGVLLGADGVLTGMRAGGLLIDTSTIGPEASRRISVAAIGRGIGAVDAPVTGGDIGGGAGTLTVMCGGSRHDVDRARPILQPFAALIVHVGPAGCGQIVKAANQVQGAASLKGMAEALALAANAGIDLAKTLQVLSSGAARCWANEHRGPRAIKGDFEPGFRVRHHYKDLGHALATGAELGVALPVAASVHQLYGHLIEMGCGDLDSSSLVTLAVAAVKSPTKTVATTEVEE